jgi:hypothetical protein
MSASKLMTGNRNGDFERAHEFTGNEPPQFMEIFERKDSSRDYITINNLRVSLVEVFEYGRPAYRTFCGTGRQFPC